MRENSKAYWAVLIGLTVLSMYTLFAFILPFAESVADGVWSFLIAWALFMGEMLLSVYIVFGVLSLFGLGPPKPSEEEEAELVEAVRRFLEDLDHVWDDARRKVMEKQGGKQPSSAVEVADEPPALPATNEAATERGIP